MGEANGLRVGLAGLGRFGKLHAAVLGNMAGVELAAICDPNAREVAAMLDKHPRALGFETYDAMLDQVALDAVFIVSPEPLHPAQAIAALDRGIATFVEKPLAMTAAEGQHVAAVAEASGVPLQVGFVLRFDVQHALLKAQIDRGDLGPLVSLRTKRNVSKAWFSTFGDRAHPMHETAIHDIDLLLWYAASPVTRVFAVASNRTGMRYPDACWALLEFASGAAGIVETSWFVPEGAPANVLTPNWRGTIDAELEIVGESGTGRVHTLDAPLTFWIAEFVAAPETGLWPELGGIVGGALREEVDHFVSRVRGGAPETTASVADAVAGLWVVEAVIASAESGQAIELASRA